MSIKLKGSSDGSVSFDAPADTSPSGEASNADLLARVTALES